MNPTPPKFSASVTQPWSLKIAISFCLLLIRWKWLRSNLCLDLVMNRPSRFCTALAYTSSVPIPLVSLWQDSTEVFIHLVRLCSFFRLQYFARGLQVYIKQLKASLDGKTATQLTTEKENQIKIVALKTCNNVSSLIRVSVMQRILISNVVESLKGRANLGLSPVVFWCFWSLVCHKVKMCLNLRCRQNQTLSKISKM